MQTTTLSFLPRALALALLVSSGAARAQVSPGAVPPAAAATAKEVPVTLSVFEVSTDKDLGYQSVSSLSGTRTGELLRNLPVSVSILNQEFLQDIAVTDSAQAMILYGIGVEPSGSNVPGVGLPGTGTGGGNALTFRGIGASWSSRDGVIWYGVSDNFNVESIEINRGPSGNVFGDSKAGGVSNIVSKRAKLRDFATINVRGDSEGSQRGTIDYNKRLTSKAAVRVNLMANDQRDWHDTAFDRRSGAAAALQYDFTPHTRLSVVGEYNNVERVSPQALYTDNFSSGYVIGSGTTTPSTVPFGTTVIQAAGATQRWTYINGRAYNLANTTTATFRQTNVALNPVNVSSAIIPRHQQWNGPSDRRDHDSKSLTLAFEHRLFEHTMLQATYNLTLSDRYDMQANLDGIRRDVNPSLPGPSGTLVANPNFDQLYVDHRWQVSHYYNRTAAYLLTAVQDLDFRITKQRLIASGSLRDDRFRLFQEQELLTPETIAASGLTGTSALQTNNLVRRRFYLKNGNDEAVRRTDIPEARFYEVTNNSGQKTRAYFYSASALLLGKYWNDRITSTVGIRRDDFEQRQVPVDLVPGTNNGTPGTGFATLRKNGSGEEIWAEQIGQYHTSWNYGAVFSPIPQARVFYNYAENFQQNGTTPYFNGDARKPREGDGIDYGASVYLWKDRITATVTRYNNTSNNETLNVLNNQLIADEINRLLGTSYTSAVNGDSQSRQARGTELELIANPTRQWTIAFKYSMRKNVNTDFAPRFQATLAALKAKTNDPTLYALTEARLGAVISENPSARAAWNYSTRYAFTKGPLKGARVGVYGYYRQGNWAYAAGRPDLYFKSYVMFNALAGYEYRLNNRQRLDFQVNVENVANQQLKVGTANTGGGYLAPTKVILQTTLRF